MPTSAHSKQTALLVRINLNLSVDNFSFMWLVDKTHCSGVEEDYVVP